MKSTGSFRSLSLRRCLFQGTTSIPPPTRRFQKQAVALQDRRQDILDLSTTLLAPTTLLLRTIIPVILATLMRLQPMPRLGVIRLLLFMQLSTASIHQGITLTILTALQLTIDTTSAAPIQIVNPILHRANIFLRLLAVKYIQKKGCLPQMKRQRIRWAPSLTSMVLHQITDMVLKRAKRLLWVLQPKEEPNKKIFLMERGGEETL